MPKAQKPPSKNADAKVKQITDFFQRKPSSTQGMSQNATRSVVVTPKNAKQFSAKENTTPHSRGWSSRADQVYNHLQTTNASADSQRFRIDGAGSPAAARIVPITSPMQPPTKRLRSQSTASPRPGKHVKRPRNILCDSKFEEEKMEVDDGSVVYVRSTSAAVPKAAPIQLSTSGSTRRKNLCHSTSPDLHSEVDSLVPSSLSEEKELEQHHQQHRDIGTIKDAVDHWRKRALPPSPSTGANSPIESEASESPAQQMTTGLGVAVDTTPTRLAPTNTSIPTPPSTDVPSDGHSKLSPGLVCARLRTEQIIADIKARAYAASHAVSEPSSPLSEVGSLESSDDEGGAFSDLGLKNNQKLERNERYNLRNDKSSAKMVPGKRTCQSESPPDNLPPTKQKLSGNPLDALLKEKKTLKNRKSVADTLGREQRLRSLADLALDDDSDNDGDTYARTSKGRTLAVNGGDGNPFIDEDQKQHVLEILKGDRDIEDEEEHLRRQGKVGVTLWSSSQSCSMDVCDDTPLQLHYAGVDPVLQIFAQVAAHGDYTLICLTLQSGALETANYDDGGLCVIDYLKYLAFSRSEGDPGYSAFQVLSHLLADPTSTAKVALFGTILHTLRALGAEVAVLERLGWTVINKPRDGISDAGRSVIIGRLVHCIRSIAKSCRLYSREIPDIVTALLLVGMDPSLSHEMRLKIHSTIHEVCQSIDDEKVVEPEVESAICNSVLRLIQPYSPQDKFHALGFCASGSGRSARIARVIAHAMLTDKTALLPSQYSSLPPLSGLMEVLEISTQDANHPRGKFEIHEGTNYVEMACWTSVLAVAVNDIPQYMENEETNRSAPLCASPSKERDRSLALALHNKLYAIHGRIQDHRAAHLDRSRTKAVIFQTAFRILYQYQSISQHRTSNSRSIQHYFRRK